VRGEISNLFRVIANGPRVLKPFFEMSHYVRDQSSLPPRLREMAILTTGVALNVPYEVFHHRRAGRQAGLSEDELRRIEAMDLRLFNETERAVMQYAHQVGVGRDVDRSVFDSLQALLAPGMIVELAVIVAWYHLVAAVVTPLRIELESNF
jgi:alkylhydroperoxidase family enzyme